MPERAAALVAFFDGLGLAPVAAIDDPLERAFRGEIAAFDFYGARLLAFIADPASSAKDTKLSFRPTADTYAYDLVSGAPLGKKKSVKVRLKPGAAAAYAFLPYETAGLEVLAPEAVPVGHRVRVQASLRAEGQVPDRHLLRVEFGRLGAAPLPYYTRHVLTAGGKGSTEWFLAQDEAPGLYTVRVRDVLTGHAAVAQVAVLP